MIQPEEDLRFERKAYIDHIDRRSFTLLILQHPALFKKLHSERIVNSLYFDTHSKSDALEKVNGLNSRRKLRIRWYGTLFGEIQNPVLEIKAKENNLGWKNRYDLRPFVIEKRSESPFQLEFVEPETSFHPQMLMRIRNPSLLVSYRRIYFISADGRFRMTVDDQLKFYHPGKNKRGWEEKPNLLHGIVVELKYSRKDDDDAREIACRYPFRWGAFSKYIEGLGSEV